MRLDSEVNFHISVIRSSRYYAIAKLIHKKENPNCQKTHLKFAMVIIFYLLVLPTNYLVQVDEVRDRSLCGIEFFVKQKKSKETDTRKQSKK